MGAEEFVICKGCNREKNLYEDNLCFTCTELKRGGYRCKGAPKKHCGKKLSWKDEGHFISLWDGSLQCEECYYA